MPPRRTSTAARKAPGPTSARPRTRASGRSRKAASIDEYLAGVPDDRRVALEKLRRTIGKIVPDAEECIRYAMPGFRLHGKVVAGFAATAKGCSYFPFSGSTLATLDDALRGYDKTKSALHFSAGKPLPAGLVRKLLRARMAEIEG